MAWLQQSLHRKILVALAFTALFALVVTGGVAYVTQRTTLEKQFSAQLNAVVDAKTTQIRTWIAERQSDVTFLSNDHFIRSYLMTLLRADVTDEEKRTAAAFLQETLTSMQRSREDYSRILIADPHGTVIVAPDQQLLGQPVANQAAFDGTIAAGLASVPEVYIQRIEYNAASGLYEMCFGQVIRAPSADTYASGSILGVLLITTDMGQSIYRFLDDWPMGETGTAVLSYAEEDGTRIVNHVRFDETKPLARFLPRVADAVAKPAQLAAQGQEGTALAIDHLGQSVITVYRYVPETHWGLVLKMNTGEIFAPLHALLAQVALIAIGVLLLSTLIAFPIARTLSNPIRALMMATRAVSAGDLSVAVPFNRRDEIGLLAHSFSEMVTNVERHQKQLKAVNQMATDILGARPCNEALYDLVQAACQLTAAEGAAIILDDYDCQHGEDWLTASPGAVDRFTSVAQANGTTALCTMRRNDASSVDVHALLTTVSADSSEFVTTPVWGQARQLGSLLIYKPLAPHDHPDKADIGLPLSDKDTLAALANYAAVVIENARRVTRLQQWNSQLEQRVAERTLELEAANAQLTQLDEMKTDFIYNVSHELRNPITNMKLQSDLLRKNIDSPHRERHINAIAKQVDIMAQLVADMLDLIQLDKMQSQIELSNLDLNTVVTEVVAKYRGQLVEHSVKLTLELANYPLPLRGERVQLGRAVGHLLRNAISYSLGGTVCVRTYMENKRLCLQVQDTGMGIAEKDLPYIFQRFFRGSNVSQSTIPGSGLGLSLVREVAKLHQGELSVKSELNQGSTFQLWFPALERVALRSRVAL